MSDAIFKASLRQTLAYIDAYNVELLRAIETDFKDALQCPDGDDEGESEDEGAQGDVEGEENLTPPEEEPPPPAPRTKRPPPEPPQPRAQAYQFELTRLPNWHFQLPFFAAVVATVLLLFAR
ncbi:hypothetical protein ACXG98_001076 [Pseudomonas aeruginosa]|nr:hypothetical protein [Pseudomonas aeruginosa]HEO1592420.1 hypothetical protein [Pseudomonas aeruginosa]